MGEGKRIAIIGHIDSGKTSLTAAITRLLAAHPGAEYEVATKNYAHVDCPAPTPLQSPNTPTQWKGMKP